MECNVNATNMRRPGGGGSVQVEKEPLDLLASIPFSPPRRHCVHYPSLDIDMPLSFPRPLEQNSSGSSHRVFAPAQMLFVP